MPEAYKGKGELGELTCTDTEVNHLQEAMPFEKIEVKMFLKELYENRLQLYFEYFAVETSGNKRKLAYGNHEAYWMKRVNDILTPSAMPEKIMENLIPDLVH